MEIAKTEKAVGIELGIVKWDRRDHGEPGYWKQMEDLLACQMDSWIQNTNVLYLSRQLGISSQANDRQFVDLLVADFNLSVNNALRESLKSRKDDSCRAMNWNSDMYTLRHNVKEAYNNFK
jgi:hypothetical protein